MEFSDPLGQVKGIGDTRSKLLANVGISTVGDLMTYLPYSYEDSTNIHSIKEARELVANTSIWEQSRLRITVKATLIKFSSIRTRRGLFIITATFNDQKSERPIKAIWFNQPFRKNELHETSNYLLYGRVQREGSSFTFQSPKLEELIEGKTPEKIGGILPIYRRVKTITTTYLRKYILEAIKSTVVEEYLPPELLRRNKLVSLEKSFVGIHSPTSIEDYKRGYQRLAIQELLELRKAFEDKYSQQIKTSEGYVLGGNLAKFIAQWKNLLPYKLTIGQEKVLLELIDTVGNGESIDALVYGDVGSGKTIIALLLAFGFAMLGGKTIVISPTTILASQHIKTAKTLLKILQIDGKVSVVEHMAGVNKQRSIPSNSVVIGTQAILHNKKLLEDKKLEFVCIDEQHRFGVIQRAELKKLRRHVLTLSATPIPRTLALSFLGFSQAHFLEDRPIGRKEVITRVVPNNKEQTTYEWMVKHLNNGEQAYIVFPRIESEEESEKQSLTAMAEELKATYFKNIPSAILHGAMKDEEKNKVMSEFSNGKLRLLFSTSVIEVGVDVANATIIAIHGAELFGLAQLHQLRGRVGRSSQQGYCMLFPSLEDHSGMERLEYFANNPNGLAVSQYDLNHRGTGTILDVQQSGMSELRVADLSNLQIVNQAMSIYNEITENKVAIKRYFRVKSGSEQ